MIRSGMPARLSLAQQRQKDEARDLIARSVRTMEGLVGNGGDEDREKIRATYKGLNISLSLLDTLETAWPTLDDMVAEAMARLAAARGATGGDKGAELDALAACLIEIKETIERAGHGSVSIGRGEEAEAGR